MLHSAQFYAILCFTGGRHLQVMCYVVRRTTPLLLRLYYQCNPQVCASTQTYLKFPLVYVHPQL